MAIVKCLNPTCEYFQKTIPEADFCPFCGEPVNLSTISPKPPTSPHPSFTPSNPPSALIQELETPKLPRQVVRTVVEKIPANLSLVHTATGKKFTIQQIAAINKVYLGRPEYVEESPTVIDLNDIPYSERVSRSHAYIYWDHNQARYMIVDDKSTNGTILNDAPLIPDQPYPLQQGDKLEFGMEQKIIFRVEIQ